MFFLIISPTSKEWRNYSTKTRIEEQVNRIAGFDSNLFYRITYLCKHGTSTLVYLSFYWLSYCCIDLNGYFDEEV